MTRGKLQIVCSLALSIAAGTAFTACSSSSKGTAGGVDAGKDAAGGGGDAGKTGVDGGKDASGGDAGGADGSSEDAGGGDTGAGTGGGEGGADGGGATSCTALADAICNEMSQCDPTGLKSTYGDVATCTSFAAQGCAVTLPETHGQVNAAACLTAYTASCDSYFETLAHSNPACALNPGDVADETDGCGYDSQCVAGDDCDLSNAAFPAPACMNGACVLADSTGEDCLSALDCDTKTNVPCVATATGTPLASDGETVCQTVTYGNTGAPCVAGTNKGCLAALYCGPNNTCVAKLAAGEACTPSDNNCDDRVHLSCVIPPGGAATACTAPTLVPAGSQCGLVSGNQQTCYGNLYCDSTTTPPTCKAQVAKDSGCVTTIAGECALPNVCATATSTCEPPPAPTCM